MVEYHHHGVSRCSVAIPEQRRGLSSIGKTRKGEDRRVQEESSGEEINEYRSLGEGDREVPGGNGR
jgi:hypothetical protein